MKKISTQILFLLLVSSAAFAQLPNASFEAWTTDANGYHPTSWMTSDQATMTYASVHSAEQNGTACDSLYSVMLTSNYVSLISNTVPGVATNGIINGAAVTSVSGGSPYTLRSAQFAGCYKYAPTSADSGRISAVLYKRNGANRDTIATAIMNTHPSGGLVNFVIDFNYRSPSTPDSILVLLMSGQGIGATNSGSVMIADNLHFIGLIGIDEVSALNDVTIFPQPASNELNIQLGSKQVPALTYEIADIAGKKLLNGSMEMADKKIDISSLSRGNYFVSLKNKEGAIVYSSKFIVSK